VHVKGKRGRHAEDAIEVGQVRRIQDTDGLLYIEGKSMKRRFETLGNRSPLGRRPLRQMIRAHHKGKNDRRKTRSEGILEKFEDGVT